MNLSRNAARTACGPGVTLLELLTVIALIAILIAIIFPVLSRANEAARTTACASNLRQIAFAMLAYAACPGTKIPPTRASR
jgi:prepilin-type N-terminal cleavage/methylation domain-containing protein